MSTGDRRMVVFDWLSKRQAPEEDPQRDKALRPVIENGKYAYIDTTGAIVIEPRFASAQIFSNGLAGVRLGDAAEDPATPYFARKKRKLGYIDYDGKMAIRPQFDDGSPFYDEDLAQVEKDNARGYIDRKGRLVIKLSGDCLRSQFSEGMAVVALKRSHKKGYIDKTGDFVIAPQFQDAFGFSEGLAAVEVDLMKCQERKWGYIDKSGRIVIEPQYEAAYSFSEGIAVVKSEGLYSFIDRNGDMAIEHRFGKAERFSEGLAPFEKAAKWGYINKTGETVIEPQFAEAQPFREGLALVKIGGKYGYIRKDGIFAITPQFDGANDFDGELAHVTLGVAKPGTPNWIHDYKRCKFGYINRMGEYIWGPICPYTK